MVFISYCTANKKIADEVVKYLEDNDVKCFIAPRDIPAGTPYARELTTAMKNCELAILIASAEINNSQHVLNEIDILINAKKTIIPFFIEDFNMLEEHHYYLGRAQRIIAYPDKVETYYEKILDTLAKHLHIQPKQTKSNQSAQILDEKTKVFKYLPARGIMINPEDRERNVSFRTDTFVNMLSGIYGEVLKLSDEKTINDIFHASGYSSGKAFAQRLNTQWDQAQDPLSLEEKLKKWCAFDSEVGWGKFEVEVKVDEESDTFSGKLTINECFIVDNINKRKICHFMKGYCEGVIETLLNVRVALNCTKCPFTSRFSKACCFEITLCD